VDDKRAARIYDEFPKAPKYKDFRKMLDKESPNIDAVICTLPDFMHATAAMHCMERGKHVYVQKPLTRTVWEARQLAEAAAKYKVATQMGNQGYSNEGTRQCAEMIWSGAIGNVTEVHAWTNRPIWPQGMTEIPPEKAVPSTLDWDLWLGIANFRPYTNGKDYENTDYGFYEPHSWRGFFDFGCGALGDMACLILGAPHMALMLGSPTSVMCVSQEGTSSFQFPKNSVIRYEFPARGSMPAVKVFWHDGCAETPRIPGVPEGEMLGNIRGLSAASGESEGPYVGHVFNYREWLAAKARWKQEPPRMPPTNGSLFIGDKGMLTTGTSGEDTRLIPVDKMADYKFPPRLLTRSPGHYRDWIRACKGGEPSCSNFSVASPFVEWMLLGVIALRFPGKLEWDAEKARFTNNAEANKYLKPTFRKGWSFV